MQNILGDFYRNLGRFEEAETAYKEALETYRELADNPPYYYPDYYLHDLTKTQDSLGVLYHTLERYDKAEKYYRVVLQGYEQLIEEYPRDHMS